MELDQIDIVAHREPEDFYNELRRLIASAQHRLVLSALYLGSGHKEQSLLQEVSSALENNPKLSVLFILDHSRARRGEKSSIDLLAPLVDKFYPRLQVCFYQMPQLKSAPYSWLPFWLQEVVAVYHCKFCVSDDTVLMTGANLSHDYFTDRQDRYWTIQSSLSVPLTADRPPLSPDVGAGPLAQYLGEFSQAVAKDSWLLSPGDRQLQPPNVAACALSAFLQQHPLHSPTVRHQQHSDSDSDKVVAFPLVQHAALGVEQEKDFFVHMLHQRQHGNSARHRRSDTAVATEALLPNMQLRQVQLCTPYTNFPKSLCNALRSVASGSSVTAEAPVHVQIIGPAPECHGFAGGKGFKEELPYLHEAALHADLFSPTKADPTTPVNIEWRQYLRPGWTLHRKGLWLGFSPEEDQATYDAAAPYQGDAKHYSWATYLGSSNFGERSWRRDLELGFFFLEAPGAAERPSMNLVSVLQRVLRSESHDLVATSHVHLLPRHRQEETLKTAVEHARRVSRPVDDERVPLMSKPTAAATATPAQLAAKQGRAQRLHIRVLGWLLRSVL